MLLNMRSGINEYDDTAVHRQTHEYPDWDISPFDYLASVNKKWESPPGTKSSAFAPPRFPISCHISVYMRDFRFT